MTDERVDRPAATVAAPKVRFGLASRVLVLTSCFVMLAEIAIYLPTLANFQNYWLRNRLSSAYTAALVFTASAEDLPEEVRRAALESAGVRTIGLKTADTRRLIAASSVPVQVDDTYDLRTWAPATEIVATLRALLAPDGRILRVIGDAPMGGEFLEITLDETPLRRALIGYSERLLFVSLLISAIVGGLAVGAIHLLVLRPVRHLTSNLVSFGAEPEDAARIIRPSLRRDEIGRAERALAGMETVLARELHQKKNLAALGLAVAKINHDLRNMLATAQLLSDRLSELSDPLAERIVPKLVGTLDRAIGFCQATLSYGRAVEQPPKRAPVPLRALVDDAAETVAPGGNARVAIRNDLPDDLVASIDADQMFRVFLNLLRNAVDALESAGPQSGRAAIVMFAGRRDGTRVTIDIADTGPGIPAAMRATLFRAFGGSSRPGGAGLGLAIAADLVRAHGGTIVLRDDDPAGGAAFRIVLPDDADAPGRVAGALT